MRNHTRLDLQLGYIKRTRSLALHSVKAQFPEQFWCAVTKDGFAPLPGEKTLVRLEGLGRDERL